MHALRERFGSLWTHMVLAVGLVTLAFAVVAATPALAADTPADQAGTEEGADVEWYKATLLDQVSSFIGHFGIVNDQGVYDQTTFDAYVEAVMNALEVADDDSTATIEEVLHAMEVLQQSVLPLLEQEEAIEALGYLSMAIENVQTFLPTVATEVNVGGFTDESWDALVDAYNAAGMMNAQSSAEAIAEATDALMSAYNAVVDPTTQPPSAQLYFMVRSAGLTVVANGQPVYTSSTYEAVVEAYEAAQALFSNEPVADPDAEQFSTAMADLQAKMDALQIDEAFSETIPLRSMIYMICSATSDALTPEVMDAIDPDGLATLSEALSNALQVADDLWNSETALRPAAHAVVDALCGVSFPDAQDSLLDTLNFLIDVADGMGDEAPDAVQEDWHTFLIIRSEAKETAESTDAGPVEITQAIGNLRGAFNTLIGPYDDEVIFRLYNPYDGSHLFTKDLNEVATLWDNGKGWEVEDIAWWAPTDPAANIPVMRLYNPYSFDHYYVLEDEEGLYEIEVLEGLGWNEEGTAWYSPETSDVPVYQLFNPYLTTNTHLWTTDANEYQVLTTTTDWEGNDIAWYAAALPE